MEFDALQPETTDFGSIQIAPEVFQAIAGSATLEVPGIVGMSGGIKGGISELLGRKNIGKGIKVMLGETETIIEISIIIQFGRNILDICTAVQEKVKHEIYSMTDIQVSKINVSVVDIHIPTEDLHTDIASDRNR